LTGNWRTSEPQTPALERVFTALTFYVEELVPVGDGCMNDQAQD